MTGRTISGSYAAQVTLGTAGDNPATIASDALLQTGLYGSGFAQWVVTNQGIVQGATGVALKAGGTVLNQDLISATAVGVYLVSPGLVNNAGTITADGVGGIGVGLRGGGTVDAVWVRLLERSGPRPGQPVTDDPGLHLLVDGRRVEARSRRGGTYVFSLPIEPAEVRVMSRAGVPAELGFARGFHAFEPDLCVCSTDGTRLCRPGCSRGSTGRWTLCCTSRAAPGIR